MSLAGTSLVVPRRRHVLCKCDKYVSFNLWRRKRGGGGMPPMDNFGAEYVLPHIRVVGQLRQIFFVVFYGCCAHTNTDILAPPPN